MILRTVNPDLVPSLEWFFFSHSFWWVFLVVLSTPSSFSLSHGVGLPSLFLPSRGHGEGSASLLAERRPPTPTRKEKNANSPTPRRKANATPRRKVNSPHPPPLGWCCSLPWGGVAIHHSFCGRGRGAACPSSFFWVLVLPFSGGAALPSHSWGAVLLTTIQQKEKRKHHHPREEHSTTHEGRRGKAAPPKRTRRESNTV